MNLLGMTKEEVKAWRARFDLVAQVELEQLRKSTPQERYRQLLTLMQMGRKYGWFDRMDSQEGEVRKRWIKLKKAARGKKESPKD